MRIAGDIDQQVAEQSIDEPEGRLAMIGRGHLRHRDFEFVKPVVPTLVNARRLAGRPDEQAGEYVGQRRMTLPIEHKAL